MTVYILYYYIHIIYVLSYCIHLIVVYLHTHTHDCFCRGVVQLFNAVKQQQGKIKHKVQEVRKSVRKTDKVKTHLIMHDCLICIIMYIFIHVLSNYVLLNHFLQFTKWLFCSDM